MAIKSREKLLARKAALEAERTAIQAKLNAALSKLSEQDRKDDTRRKILVGSFYLARARIDERANAGMLKDMSGHLTREDDRKLFGLLPLPEKADGASLQSASIDTTALPPPVIDDPARPSAH